MLGETRTLETGTFQTVDHGIGLLKTLVPLGCAGEELGIEIKLGKDSIAGILTDETPVGCGRLGCVGLGHLLEIGHHALEHLGAGKLGATAPMVEFSSA